MPSEKHIVASGDHATRIAVRHGFRSYETIWRAPENAELAARSAPHLLAPGSEVVVPEKRTKTLSVSTGARHVFTLKTTRLKLCVQLRTASGQPLEGPEPTFKVDGQPSGPRSTSPGRYDLSIPPATVEAEVAFRTESETAQTSFATCAVGALAPIDVDAGVIGRLINLGYLFGSTTDHRGEDEIQLALEELQVDAGLPVTGALDEATRDRLRELHGV